MGELKTLARAKGAPVTGLKAGLLVRVAQRLDLTAHEILDLRMLSMRAFKDSIPIESLSNQTEFQAERDRLNRVVAERDKPID